VLARTALGASLALGIPVAVADATPHSGAPPLDVSFNGRRSSDQDGDPLDYSWSFGDGATSGAAAPTHRYSTPGTYTARLTVNDDLGGTSTDTKTISVGVSPGTQLLPGGPGAADRTGPKLRLLGVNAARGRIRGSAADKSGVGEVSVALRRKVRGGGCSWWLKGKRRLSAGRRPCDKPRWMDARLTSASGGVRWLLKLRRALPPGNYRVLVRAVDGKGNEARLPTGPGSIIRVARGS
jgi:PKD repeat protein